ncbi:MAG: peptidyl-prolyl cis-trans isomerase, partial [Solirubrobacterales bacterium]|nr:peptidyl-prolyl cis-trans isomerase [Solirubrobacterales bacterium]
MARRDRNRGRRRKPDERQEAAAASARRRERERGHRRLAGIVLGLLVIALFAGVAIAQGLGRPSPSDGELAVVEEAPDGTVTSEEITAELERTPQTSRLEPGTPQYEEAVKQVLDELILGRWVAGEAAEQGIEVSDRDVDRQLEEIIEQQLGGQAEFEQFLGQQGFSEEQVRDRVRLQVLSTRIQEALVPAEPEIPSDQIEQVYEANIDQFTTPETRDVRLVLTRDRAEADAALAELADDSSAESFERVARKYSVDEATKDTGGLREAVAEGQSEPALDGAIFTAAPGVLAGPIETEAGFYILQVENVNPEEVVPFSEAEPDLRTSLTSSLRDQLTQEAAAEFFDKWRARTYCDTDYLITRCSNNELADSSAQVCPPAAALADPPQCAPTAGEESCNAEVAGAVGCQAAVPSLVPAPPQEFEIDPADPVAASTPPPTPAWETAVATLSGSFSPGLAQNAYIEPPDLGEAQA